MLRRTTTRDETAQRPTLALRRLDQRLGKMRSSRRAAERPRLVTPTRLGCWPFQDDDQEDRCDVERDDREEVQPRLLHTASIRVVAARSPNAFEEVTSQSRTLHTRPAQITCADAIR